MDTVNNSAIEYTDSTGVQNKKKLIKATLNDNQSISNLSIGYGHQHKYYPHKVRNNNNNCSSPFWRDFLKRVLLFFFNKLLLGFHSKLYTQLQVMKRNGSVVSVLKMYKKFAASSR